MNSKAIGGFLQAQYDKLIAALVFVLVLGSLLYLGLRLGSMSKMKQDFRSELDRLTPLHPHAAGVEAAPFEEAKLRLLEPSQIPEWTNALFVPETRVWCVDCRRPIPYHALTCPICRAAQPPLPPMQDDQDRDGMSDVWEKEHGLNPADPRDANMDPDHDGFSNLEEFLAKPRTDPADPASRPPIVSKLVVTRIDPIVFNLLFMSVLKLPDGTVKYGFNTRIGRDTIFARIGETVEGFTLSDYEPNFVPVERQGITIMEDRSVLILKHKEKTIRLVRGERRTEQDYEVHFLFRLDKSEFTAKIGETFKLLDKEYRLISVDTERQAVVIEREFDGERWDIGEAPLLGTVVPGQGR